jgi:hypothetical protein
VGNWHDGASFASIHTQSPCKTCPSGSYATGGLDDRFDMFLPTYNMNDGEGLELLPATYIPVGNDGLHLNLTITDSPTIPEGADYAYALWMASDHLPVRVDIQLPPLSSVPTSLAFGTVIVGATAEQALQVSNVATVPADELDYTLAAPAGFSAPSGPFQALAGAGPNSHTVTMDTGTSGDRGGDLVLSSDDPENPTRNFPLSGKVLEHASPSLDSLAVLLASTLDYGTREAGSFPDTSFRVFNHGYGPSQARLSLTAANLVGGDGRFSLVGGFTPILLADLGQTYTVHFDDAGATPDVPYAATLTFTSADETLPGALPRPDLVLTLSATVGSGSVAVETADRPTVTRLLPARPNPAPGFTALRFDLAQPAAVTLHLFDLRGRRVRTLVAQPLDPARHAYTWDGRDDAGHQLPAGIYFVRFAAGSLHASQRLVLLR